MEDAEYLVNGALWLQAALFDFRMRFSHETFDDRSQVERVYLEIKRRTNQFTISLLTPNPKRLKPSQVLGWAWNELI